MRYWLWGKAVDVDDLFCSQQSETVDDVEMFLDEDEQTFDSVETLDSSTAEHVSYLHNKKTDR